MQTKADARTCVDLSGSVSNGVSDDLDSKPVIAGHAVDAYVGRVALTDVHCGRAAPLTSSVVGRHRPADDKDDGGGDERQQPDRRTTRSPWCCLLYTSPSPRDRTRSRMPSSA